MKLRPSAPEPAPLPRSQNSPQITQLENQVERLMLITEALWSILREQHGYGEKELLRRIVEIDMKDGKLDGRVAPSPPETCPKCSRVTSRLRICCMFCDEPRIVDPFAR